MGFPGKLWLARIWDGPGENSVVGQAVIHGPATEAEAADLLTGSAVDTYECVVWKYDDVTAEDHTTYTLLSE